MACFFRGSVTNYFCLLLCFLPFLSLTGCGSGQIAAPSIQAQTQHFDDALSKMKSKDYAGAKEAAAAALGGPGLSADQVVEASMILIEAALETKDLETADSKLSEVEGVATDMGKVCVLRGRYWRKKGDETKAQKSFQDARLHDPNVLIPN